jgi:hypothetical protein
MAPDQSLVVAPDPEQEQAHKYQRQAADGDPENDRIVRAISTRGGVIDGTQESDPVDETIE